MSVCELSTNEISEKLLIDDINCDECKFIATDEILLGMHVKEAHGQ